LAFSMGRGGGKLACLSLGSGGGTSFFASGKGGGAFFSFGTGGGVGDAAGSGNAVLATLVASTGIGRTIFTSTSDFPADISPYEQEFLHMYLVWRLVETKTALSKRKANKYLFDRLQG